MVRGAAGVSMETIAILKFAEAAIAQLGERQTEDLKVPGSIPGLGTGKTARAGARMWQAAKMSVWWTQIDRWPSSLAFVVTGAVKSADGARCSGCLYGDNCYSQILQEPR